MVKNFNESSMKTLDSPNTMKVEIKYNNRPPQLSLKEHIDKLKEVKRKRNDGRPLSPIKDGHLLDSPTLMINN